MLTGRRYRLKLTPEQTFYAEQIGNICRDVWNTGLEQRRSYRRRGAWINYGEQCRQLAEAKLEHIWLKDAPGHCLQQALKDLDRACREWGTFKVHWRSQRRWSPSFRFPEGSKIQVEKLSKKWWRAKLPRLGWVTFDASRTLGGLIRSATVSRDGTHWFVAFLVEDGKSTPERHHGTPVGVDRGVKAAVALSNGNLHDHTFTGAGERERYLRLQRKLARAKKNSRNRKKVIAKLGITARRARQRRADFCAQTAAKLVTRHSLIVLEDLKVKNMTASAKGTLEQPGRNVAQKCGYQDHADVNAAKNILAAGLAVSACGDLGVGRSVKQEPAGP